LIRFCEQVLFEAVGRLGNEAAFLFEESVTGQAKGHSSRVTRHLSKKQMWRASPWQMTSDQ
jgi:hypothetical protein